MRVPAEIPVAKVAEAKGITHKAAVGLLRRAGILERIGRLHVVYWSRLRDRLPDTAEEVFTLYELDGSHVTTHARS